MSFMFGQMAKITDNLYLSAACAVTPDKLRNNGISCVINCTSEIPSVNLPDVECMRISIDDTPTQRISAHFDRCADKVHLVRGRGGRTLVHCAAGVSRSASVCIAYLMKHHHMSLKDAYNHVKTCRPVIRPNPGFFHQLIEYERKLFGASTVVMVTSPIGYIPDVYRTETRNMIMIPAGIGRYR